MSKTNEIKRLKGFFIIFIVVALSSLPVTYWLKKDVKVNHRCPCTNWQDNVPGSCGVLK